MINNILFLCFTYLLFQFKNPYWLRNRRESLNPIVALASLDFISGPSSGAVLLQVWELFKSRVDGQLFLLLDKIVNVFSL